MNTFPSCFCTAPVQLATECTVAVSNTSIMVPPAVAPYAHGATFSPAATDPLPATAPSSQQGAMPANVPAGAVLKDTINCLVGMSDSTLVMDGVTMERAGSKAACLWVDGSRAVVRASRCWFGDMVFYVKNHSRVTLLQCSLSSTMHMSSGVSLTDKECGSHIPASGSSPELHLEADHPSSANSEGCTFSGIQTIQCEVSHQCVSLVFRSCIEKGH